MTPFDQIFYNFFQVVPPSIFFTYSALLMLCYILKKLFKGVL